MGNAWIPLGMAILDWFSIRFGWDRLQKLTKPAVILAILAWILLDGPGLGTPIAWFFLGAVFSLAGDILLLPPFDRFVQALFVFILAHLAYIIGLNTTPFPINASTGLFLIIILLLVSRVYSRISTALAKQKSENFRLPVLLYTIVLSTTLLSGLATLAKDPWSPTAALLAAGGAVLLALSDILLVWDRFIGEIPGARLKIRVTYHIGQIMLIGGAIMFF